MHWKIYNPQHSCLEIQSQGRTESDTTGDLIAAATAAATLKWCIRHPYKQTLRNLPLPMREKGDVVQIPGWGRSQQAAGCSDVCPDNYGLEIGWLQGSKESDTVRPLSEVWWRTLSTKENLYLSQREEEFWKSLSANFCSCCFKMSIFFHSNRYRSVISEREEDKI